MKQLVIKPSDFEMPFSECPAGLFVCNDCLCLKTEYGLSMKKDAFCDSGEFFAKTDEKVVPCKAEWIEQ